MAKSDKKFNSSGSRPKSKSDEQPILKATVTQSKANQQKNNVSKQQSSSKNGTAFLTWIKPYLPGLLLFFAALIIGIITYQGYGVSWDETRQRHTGEVSMNYVQNGDQDLFTYADRFYGIGFELPLIYIEKLMNLTDSRDIFLMRHIVTHIFFLISVFAGYVLIFKLFKNKFVASLGFIMLAFSPRIYAHSFFNSKDLPFLSMFLITLWCCQVAFEKNKPWLFFILGILCGYTTSIRIMGIMLGCFIGLFLLIDLINSYIDKTGTKKSLINISLFLVGFLLLLYLGWPYLWNDPINNFMESFKSFSHFGWTEYVLLNGKYYRSNELPWTYFPTWFLITNPEVWLVAGFTGIVLIIINFFRKPLSFLKNTTERNFLLYLMCFSAPILALIVLHSVIYDDWRHLYFVYPSFVLMALYFVNKVVQTKYKLIIQGICILQIAVIGFFMIINYPYNNLYFNNFVSHGKEYLRNHYDMDYWGCSFRQGLEHLLKTDTSKIINVTCDEKIVMDNNKLLIPEEERKRIRFAFRGEQDYIITNYRYHPFNYPPYKVNYSISVLNSTILTILEQEKDIDKLRQLVVDDVAILSKSLVSYPNNYFTHWKLADAYFKLSEYDSSAVHYKMTVQLNPTNIYAFNKLIDIYLMQKRYLETIASSQDMIKMDMVFVEPYADIAESYFNLSRFDSSIYYSAEAIAVDPSFSGAYKNLALVYNAMGKLDSAKKYETITQKKEPGFKL